MKVIKPRAHRNEKRFSAKEMKDRLGLASIINNNSSYCFCCVYMRTYMHYIHISCLCIYVRYTHTHAYLQLIRSVLLRLQPEAGLEITSSSEAPMVSMFKIYFYGAIQKLLRTDYAFYTEIDQS